MAIPAQDLACIEVKLRSLFSIPRSLAPCNPRSGVAGGCPHGDPSEVEEREKEICLVDPGSTDYDLYCPGCRTGRLANAYPSLTEANLLRSSVMTDPGG